MAILLELIAHVYVKTGEFLARVLLPWNGE